MSAPAPLTDPALLRSLIRSLPTTPSPGPAIPVSDQGGRSPHRWKRVPQPHTSTSITTPWNDTLSAMSSQLPAPQPGRPATDTPTEDDVELPPEPRGLLRTLSRWYHRHPTIIGWRWYHERIVRSSPRGSGASSRSSSSGMVVLRPG